MSASSDKAGIAPVATPAPRHSLLLYGVTLLTFMAASSVPTPLYRLYQDAWGFSAAMLTAIFGVYVFTLLLSVLTVGSLSDHVGRKPVIVVSLCVQIVAVVLFIVASDVTWLLAARAVQGLATGAAMGALGAGLIDADRTRGPVFNSLAPLIGLAIGVLSCSALVDFAPKPLHIAYYVLLALFLLLLVVASTATDTVSPAPGALASLRPKVHLPRRLRRKFFLSVPVSLAGWAMAGLFFSLLPSVVRQATGSPYALASGSIIGVTALSGVAGTILARPYSARRAIFSASACLSLGTLGTIGGILSGSVVVMLIAACIAGAGFGMGFLGAIKATTADVQAHERAGVMSALMFSSYVAFSVPALLAGLAARQFGLIPTALGYGCCVIVLAIASLASTIPRVSEAEHA